eukprot:scaffold1123_cov168-Amphora_coffeaeformis.AAC.29
MSSPSNETYSEIMNSMTFDMCSESSVVEHSHDTEEHAAFLRDGFQTPPPMALYSEFPPTFIFKSESNTILDFTSFDDDLCIPEPTESCDETVGSESTTLMPSFLALRIDAMVTDQISSLTIPSLNTVPTNSSDQGGYEADTDRTVLQTVSALSNTNTTTATQPLMDKGQLTIQTQQKQDFLAKRPSSSQHPLQMPRRKSMGAHAA